MEHVDVSKFFTSLAVFVVTVFIRYIFSSFIQNYDKLKIRASSVELIDKIINERKWKDRQNRLVIEEAFEQLYTKPLAFDEIKVLLYSKNPNMAFRTYLRYRNHLELNENKTKFRFKKGKNPYFCLFRGKLKVPKSMPIGVIYYILFASPASLVMFYMLESQSLNDSDLLIGFLKSLIGEPSALQKPTVILIWLMDIMAWVISIIHLLKGMKYQQSENDIVKHLSDKFEVKNRA